MSREPLPRHPMHDFADELAGRQAEQEQAERDRADGRRMLWWGAALAVALAAALWWGWPPHAYGAPSLPDCQLPPADCRAEGAAPKDQARVASVPVRVIDGDTIDIAGERLRLADIDTPELAGACDAEKNLARLAAARLTALLLTHTWAIRRERSKPSAKHPDGRIRTDRYGRTLAVLVTLSADGTTVSVGQVLISEGLAAPWAGRRHDWCGWAPRRGR